MIVELPLLRQEDSIIRLLVTTPHLRIGHLGTFTVVGIIPIGVVVVVVEAADSPLLPITIMDIIGNLAITIVIVGANRVYIIGDHRHRVSTMTPSIRVVIGGLDRRHCKTMRVLLATETVVIHSGVSINANICI